jgi:uncharacterized protein (TIGR02001 family)
MKKRSLALLAFLAVPVVASAQAPTAAPLTGNVTFASDYRFRGVSQSYLGPAFQGGIDYAHPGGVYLGNWNSNVSSAVYTGGAGLEMDFYGGWKHSYGEVTLDVGTIYYYYPQAECNQNNACATAGSTKFDNLEVYVGATLKWFTLKYSYALTNYFGLGKEQAAGYWTNKETNTPLGGTSNSHGTWYVDLAATIPLSKELSFVGHYGTLEVENYGALSYNDWKLGITYDLNGWLLGAAYVDTDADKNFYYTFGSRGNKETATATVVFTVTKTF